MATTPQIDFSQYEDRPRKTTGQYTAADLAEAPLQKQQGQYAAADVIDFRSYENYQEQGHQNRMSLLSGLPGALPTINMTPEDKESLEQGKAAGAISAPLVAAATVTGPSGMVAALMPIAKRYGIKALEGAGLGAGYDLYRELRKVFEGE